MGGSPDSESPIKFDWEAHKPDRGRLAVLRAVTGVPAFVLCVFGLFFTYRYLDRPLGDLPFWAILGTVFTVFSLYFLKVWLMYRRAKRDAAAGSAKTPGESSGNS